MEDQQAALDQNKASDMQLEKVISPINAEARVSDPLEFIREIISLNKEYPKLLKLQDSLTTLKQKKVLEDVQNLMAGIEVADDKGPSIFDDMAAYKQKVFENCARLGVKYEDPDALPPQNPTPDFIRICQETLREYPRLNNEFFERAISQSLEALSPQAQLENNLSAPSDKSIKLLKKRQNRELDIAIRRSLALHQQLEIYPDQIKNQMKIFYKGIARQAHKLLQELEDSRVKEASASAVAASEEVSKLKLESDKNVSQIPLAEAAFVNGSGNIPIAVAVIDKGQDLANIHVATPVKSQNTAKAITTLPAAINEEVNLKNETQPLNNKESKSSIESAYLGAKSVVHAGAVGLGGVNYAAQEVTKVALDFPLGICQMLDSATGGKINDKGKREAKGELYLLTDFVWLLSRITGGVFKITGGLLEELAEASMSPQQRAAKDSLTQKDKADIGNIKAKVDKSIENVSKSNSLVQQEKNDALLGGRGNAADPDFTIS